MEDPGCKSEGLNRFFLFPRPQVTHKQANGFYGSSGISSRIPEGYTYLEHRFWKRVVEAGRANDVQLNEWQEEGWTYHAKGG